uniref:Uncharacterized protein n=1 Tax=Rhizophagus irregularis (strain DAOM 181602 / DAOM 197198 / MUCL 43194) TaxID=747089 RepID=U9SYX9_RHIID
MYMPEVMWYYYVYYWFLVTAVRALKDALQTLGHVTSINATLCKIDLASTSTSVTATEEKNAPTQAIVWCKYISTILHTAVNLLDGLVITPQANIIGEENTSRVDFAINKNYKRNIGGNNLHNRGQAKSGDRGYLPKFTTMSKCV